MTAAPPAEFEIGEHGFHAASVSSITRRTGVAQGTFYLYRVVMESQFVDESIYRRCRRQS